MMSCKWLEEGLLLRMRDVIEMNVSAAGEEWINCGQGAFLILHELTARSPSFPLQLSQLARSIALPNRLKMGLKILNEVIAPAGDKLKSKRQSHDHRSEFRHGLAIG
jgi:hypothetical protein